MTTKAPNENPAGSQRPVAPKCRSRPAKSVVSPRPSSLRHATAGAHTAKVKAQRSKAALHKSTRQGCVTLLSMAPPNKGWVRNHGCADAGAYRLIPCDLSSDQQGTIIVLRCVLAVSRSAHPYPGSVVCALRHSTTNAGGGADAAPLGHFSVRGTISSISVLIDIGVPNRLGIDHSHRPSRAAVQTPALFTRTWRAPAAGRLDLGFVTLKRCLCAVVSAASFGRCRAG